MTSLEQLYNAHFRGIPTVALSGSGIAAAFAGRTSIGSGVASVVVSTTLVKSDSIFHLAEQVGSVSTAANSGGGIAVNSIVDGVSFALVRPTGLGVPWGNTVMWTMYNTTRP